MRQLLALAAIFAILSNHAWAFDRSPEVVGKMYFSIPFGTATKDKATPQFGFRVSYGDGLTFADGNKRLLRSELD